MGDQAILANLQVVVTSFLLTSNGFPLRKGREGKGLSSNAQFRKLYPPVGRTSPESWSHQKVGAFCHSSNHGPHIDKKDNY